MGSLGGVLEAQTRIWIWGTDMTGHDDVSISKKLGYQINQVKTTYLLLFF